jgi:HAD superfamily hydrolase (TIGR01490 family)
MRASRISFFDVDHTVVRSSTGLRFAQTAFRRGLLSARTLARIPIVYLAYRFGVPGIPGTETYIPAFSGFSPRVLEEMAGEAFAKYVASDIYPAAARLIADLVSRGSIVVLATSSMDFIIRPLAEALGVSATIASKIAYEDGLSTGLLDGDLVFGAEKLERARSFAAERGIRLSECSFYTDSVHDLPLMLEVGESVAVNPDRRLAAEARNRGWKILRFGSVQRRSDDSSASAKRA